MEDPLFSQIVKRIAAKSDDGAVTAILFIREKRVDGKWVREVETEGGKRCSQIDENTWRIDASGVILRRVKE